VRVNIELKKKKRQDNSIGAPFLHMKVIHKANVGYIGMGAELHNAVRN
jgi:hypothetical protein